MNKKLILAIETSCDETSAAVVSGDGTKPIKVHANVIATQVALHAQYGGVYPDLAAAEHVKRIVPVISLALHEAKLTQKPEISGKELQKALAKIDAIAVTVGPGLIGSLLIGTNTAAALTALSGKPAIPVNHWEGHIYSVFLEKTIKTSVIPESNEIRHRLVPKRSFSKGESSSLEKLPDFPMLLLTVSGGHSSIILMQDHFDYEILGSTIDDAAGEAFDKCARMLDLGFPGGPALSRAAAKARSEGLKLDIKLPRPMLHDGGGSLKPNTYNLKPALNMSFSGLKTAVRYAIERGDIKMPDDSAAAAREVEDAIVEVLVTKTLKAAQAYKPASIAVVGGVSANQELRKQMAELLISKSSILDPNSSLYFPDLSYTTDNAAMIAAAGLFRFIKGKDIGTHHDLTANAALRLETK